MTSTTHPPTAILMAATWWIWLLRVGDRLGGLRRRLRRDRRVRVSVQVGAPFIIRRQAMAGWLEQTGRAVFDSHDEPPMPIRVIVTSEAGLPGSHDLGWVRAAYRVADGPDGRRAIVWLGALQPRAAAQRVDDWLAAGLTWALLCLGAWDETMPRLAALPMPGATLAVPPVAPLRSPDSLGGAPRPANPTGPTRAAGHSQSEDGVGVEVTGPPAASPAPGDVNSPAGGHAVGGVTINGQPPEAPPAREASTDTRGPVAAAGEAMVPLTTSAPPAELSYPAEE
jgi:hypothetical protein